MIEEWMTTGEAATMLGVSRQHVVNLCDRGDLHCSRAGSHRRVRRSEVKRLVGRVLTREQEKSLWLHRALLGALVLDPEGVLEVAQQNIARWKLKQRPDGMATRYLQQWEQVIAGGVDAVAAVFTGQDELSSELRQNSPFAGALVESQRQQVLRSFREHWDSEHSAA